MLSLLLLGPTKIVKVDDTIRLHVSISGIHNIIHVPSLQRCTPHVFSLSLVLFQKLHGEYLIFSDNNRDT